MAFKIPPSLQNLSLPRAFQIQLPAYLHGLPVRLHCEITYNLQPHDYHGFGELSASNSGQNPNPYFLIEKSTEIYPSF